MPIEFDALKYLVEDVKRQETIEIDGRTYETRGLSPVKEPIIKCLSIHTLQGIVDFFSNDSEIQDENKIFIHIKGHNEVSLISFPLGTWKQREIYLQATLPDEKRFHFNDWMPIEDMIIELLSKMVMTENLTSLIDYLSRVEDVTSRVSEDNGIGQITTTTTKIGGVYKQEEEAPRRKTLIPYRTFMEIDPQPESEFVFRIRKGKVGIIECALFDADSGKWKLEAIQGIRTYFEDKLPGIKIIA